MKANAYVYRLVLGDGSEPVFAAHMKRGRRGLYPTFDREVAHEIVAWTNRLADQGIQESTCGIHFDDDAIRVSDGEREWNYSPDAHGRYALGVGDLLGTWGGWDWQISQRFGLQAAVLRAWHSNANGGVSDDPDLREVYVLDQDVPGARVIPDSAVTVRLGATRPGYTVARPTTVDGWCAASGAYIVQTGCYDEWREVFGHSLPIPLHDYVVDHSDGTDDEPLVEVGK